MYNGTFNILYHINQYENILLLILMNPSDIVARSSY